jgi:hypothetical protein
MPVLDHPVKVRTTVRVPKPLYEEAQHFVQREDTALSTINEFVVAAICAYVKLMRRKQIDAAFALMKEDVDYQKQALLLAEEFTQSDWETLAMVEDEARVG